MDKTKDDIRSFMAGIDTKRDDLEERLKSAFEEKAKQIALISLVMEQPISMTIKLVAHLAPKSSCISINSFYLRLRC